MNRLFLASSGLESIKNFVRVDPTSLKMLFIPTAGNLDSVTWWIDKDRDVLARMGFQISELDIEQASVDEQNHAMENIDIVYIAGGNTFHLLKQLRESGFEQILISFVKDGGMYAGASAGALVAGKDISPVSSIDEPEKVQGLDSTKGLGLVDIVPIPHYDMKDRTKAIDKIVKEFEDEYKLVLLNDDQAIIVEDDNWNIVDSKRSQLEHGWYNKFH